MTTWFLPILLLAACGEEEPTSGTLSSPAPPEPALQVEEPPPEESLKPISERLNKDNGFRNATMGQPRSEFQGLQRRKKWDVKEEGTRAWAKKGEYLLVGAATVERIVYRFRDDRLFSVTLYSEDLVHCSTLREVFTEMYGPGRPGDSGFDQTVWWGEDVQLIFTSMLDCSAEYSWRTAQQEFLEAALAPQTATEAAADQAETVLGSEQGSEPSE